MGKAKKRNISIYYFEVMSIIIGCLVILISISPLILGRYTTTDSNNDSAQVAAFVGDVVIDNQATSIPFANADYIKDGVVMNQPIATPVSIRNYTETKTSMVNLDFELVFYIPTATLAKSAAIQLATKDGKKAITPLYVLSDFIDNTNTVVTDSNRYGGLEATEETFTYTDGIYKASTINYDESSATNSTIDATIKIEKLYLPTSYTVTFSVKSQSDIRLPKLYVVQNTVDTVQYCKISIGRTGFNLTSGSKNSYDMIFRLVPIIGMTDTDTNIIDENFLVQWDNIKNYITANQLKVSSANWEVVLNTDTKALNFIDKTNPNNPIVYENVWLGESSNEELSHGESSGKSYPCRINALFKQTEAKSN